MRHERGVILLTNPSQWRTLVASTGPGCFPIWSEIPAGLGGLNHRDEGGSTIKEAIFLHYMLLRYQGFLLTATLLGLAAYLYPIHHQSKTQIDCNMAAARISRSVVKRVYAAETSEVR
jgi:hypothetical protein